MTKPEETIIGGNQKPQAPEPGKEKAKDVHIKQGMPVASMNPMTGQPDLLVFGLGEDDMIYVWDAKNRVWRER